MTDKVPMTSPVRAVITTCEVNENHGTGAAVKRIVGLLRISYQRGDNPPLHYLDPQPGPWLYPPGRICGIGSVRREGIAAGAQHGHEDGRGMHLTALRIVMNRNRGAGVIDEHLLAGAVLLPQHQVQLFQHCR